MAVVLWGYLEELILYHLGAYACFDLKTRMPWLQMVGAGVCVLLACVSDIPSSITSYGVMLCVVFFALKEEWKRRFWHVGVLFVLISGMGEIVERLATTSRSRINSHACFRFKIFCTSVAVIPETLPFSMISSVCGNDVATFSYWHVQMRCCLRHQQKARLLNIQLRQVVFQCCEGIF